MLPSIPTNGGEVTFLTIALTWDEHPDNITLIIRCPTLGDGQLEGREIVGKRYYFNQGIHNRGVAGTGESK